MAKLRRAGKWLGANIGAAVIAIGVEKLIGLVGVAAVLAILLRLYSKVRGLPQDWYITGAIFIGALMLIALSIILTRRKNKKSSEETPEAKIPSEDSWVQKSATRQAENIHTEVVILDCTLSYKELESAAPYVNFNFHVLNMSVYTLCFEKSIDGWINFAGRRLGGNIKRTDANRPFSHGQATYLVVTQWLSKEDVALIDSSNLQCMFTFENLEITIRGDDRFPEDRSVLRQKLEIKCRIERAGRGVLQDDPWQVISERDSLKKQFEKLARPDIHGELKEVLFEKEINLNTSLVISQDCYFYYWFYLRLYIANEGAATSIERYRLVLKTKESIHEGQRLSLRGYSIHDAMNGGLGVENLIDIEDQNDVAFEHTRNGWVCFGVPSVKSDKNDGSDEEMEIEVEVIDKTKTPHALGRSARHEWRENPRHHWPRIEPHRTNWPHN